MTKIGIYQSDHEYPALHIMVTDNERYQERRKLFDDVDSAVANIRTWLLAHVAEFENRRNVPLRLEQDES